MAKFYRTKFFMALTAGCLLSVAALAEAQQVPYGRPVQNCTTRYNRGMRQYETQCQMQNTVNFNAAFQTPEFKRWHEQMTKEGWRQQIEEHQRRCTSGDKRVAGC